MPTQRIIKSTFIGLNGEPLRNAVVQVIHMQGNTINNIEYPQVTKNFITNREGKINFILWCNEEGERASFYRFILPGGETFDAIVPVGTSDLELSTLREGGGDSSAPQYQSLISYILSEVGSGVTISKATPTVAGTVKINSTSTDPVVYLKSEVDTLLADVTGFDLTNYYDKTEANTLLNTKADKSTTYTKTQTDALLSGVTVDLSGYYTKTQTDGLVTPKANSSDVNAALSLKANTTDVNSALAAKANQSTTYSKTEVDNLVATSDTLVELTDVAISSPSNTQVLAYNSTTSKWTNQTISAGGTGETNTASNVGVSGVGVFKQKTGANLEFRNINAGSTKVSITNDTTNNEIDVDVVESNLTLGNLSGTLPVAKGGTGSTSASAALTALGAASSTTLTSHTSNVSNPHSVTAAQVGAIPASEKAVASGVATLDSGAKIPDIQIPDSITRDAELTAGLATKADATALTSHTGDTGNPHSTTAAQVGAIATSARGAANGVASLDSNTLIPTAQIPSSIARVTDITATQVGNTTAQWNADKIRGIDVHTTAPTDGQTLVFNSTNNRYEPATIEAEGSGLGDVVQRVYSQVSTVEQTSSSGNYTHTLQISITPTSTSNFLYISGVLAGIYKLAANASHFITVSVYNSTSASTVALVASNWGNGTTAQYLPNIPFNLRVPITGTGARTYTIRVNVAGGAFYFQQNGELSAITIFEATPTSSGGGSGGGGGSTTLAALTDVALSTPTEGQSLTYNATTSKWVNSTVSGGGGSGETNTASNVGVAGVGVFKQKTGVNLEFRNVIAASTKASVVLDAANNEIDIDVNEANLTLGNIGGTLPLTKGGTGATTASAALTALGGATTASVALKADLASPTFTGVPLSTTPTAGDSTTKIATTAFVTNAVSTKADTSALTSHTSNTSNPHSTTAAQVGAIATTARGAANGVASLDASTLIPDAQLPASVARTSDVNTALALKANLASPTFTGTVAVPNQTAGDSSTKAANTAFVTTALSTKADTTTVNSALALKADTTALTTHISDTANPHGVTASQVGNAIAQWNASQLRGKAISATAPTSGQVLVYNSTTDTYEPSTIEGGTGGGSGGAVGAILQVKNSTLSTELNYFNPSSVNTSQVLSVVITPASTSNTFLINFDIQGIQSTAAVFRVILTRNGTSILERRVSPDQSNAFESVSVEFLDSPATTAAITYAISIGATVSANSSINKNNGTLDPQGFSYLTVMEVGAASGGGSGSGESNTASNVGVSGVGVFKQKTGADLEFKNINAGSTKITVTNDSTNSEIDIDINEANLSLSNIGGTLPISKGGTGATNVDQALENLGVLTVFNGHADDVENPHLVTPEQVGNQIDQWNASHLRNVEIDAATPTNGQVLVFNSSNSKYVPTNISGGSGESNTASNIGIAGVGIFKQKTGVNLEFKNLNVGSGKVSITDDTANNEVDIDINEANLTLDNIGGTLSISKGGTGSTSATAALTALGGIPLTQKAAASGVATLDSGSKIPDAQIPDSITRDSELTAGLATKADSSSLTSHTGNTSNPHSTTAAQVGAIATSARGTSNGVASLDTNSLIPVAQIPTTIARVTDVTAAQVGNNSPQWNASKLQGVDVINTAPSNGQVLTYNSTNLKWEPATPSGGGGGASNGLLVGVTTVNFNSSTTVSMFTLPANAEISRIEVLLDVSWVTGTTSTLSVGIAGNTSKYMSSSSIDLYGVVKDNYITNVNLPANASSEAIIATYAAGTASAGRAIIHTYYSVPS